ncbi:unnamed protein product [Phytophthora lilii]|uniref:Unnamed protein product n=1 Tax=Phytophthora lilii TaxID=2077276 RepID=A0A9W6T865_9STRA|nr:unnamed protein product [Phytophthora lilii]
MSTSRVGSSWRYGPEDKQEMSLDELISDFQHSATSLNGKLRKSAASSNASRLPVSSPPKHSKAKESGKKGWGFTDRRRPPGVVNQKSAKTTKAVKAAASNSRDDGASSSSNDDEGAVMPMPRIDRVLRNKLSLPPKRRVPTMATTRSKMAPTQRRKLPPASPALSSPSLTSPSLSPVTSSSTASSPLSVSKDINASATPDEDSIDALIGKDIRDLNKLISIGSRSRQLEKATTSAIRSPTSDDVSKLLRQSTRFRRMEQKNVRSPLRIQVSRGRSKSAIPESPPPPPPPEEDEDSEENEEDSFAEEIRKLRENRRENLTSIKVAEDDSKTEMAGPESSEICANAALKIRNVSNVINGLLHEALRPFEERQHDEEKAKALEKESPDGDAVIRNARTAELQSATQTIVSQLDLTFAEMVERRNADIKADIDAATAAKDAEKKEKETAEEAKKAEEKEAKEREMETLRLIPLQGKLLTCSSDINKLLDELEKRDASDQHDPIDSAAVIEAEIKALRGQTRRKMMDIESNMLTTPSKHSDEHNGISWRGIDWVSEDFGINQQTLTKQSSNEKLGNAEDEAKEGHPIETNGHFQEVLQRQVLEKLDLTMLQLKHVLAIDAKEEAEAQEKQQLEQEEQAKKQAQQQLEDERQKRKLQDAKIAMQRVMGITSVDEVNGWIEEGRQIQEELQDDRSLNHLMASLDKHMTAESTDGPSNYEKRLPRSQEEALFQFDRLARAMTDHKLTEQSGWEESMLHHSNQIDDMAFRHNRRYMQRSKTRPRENPMLVDDGSSDSDNCSTSTDPDSGEDPFRFFYSPRSRNMNHNQNSSLPSHLHSITPQTKQVSSKFDTRQRAQSRDEKIHSRQQRDGLEFLVKKQRKRRNCSSGLLREVEITIQALQAERRQKTSWIRNYLQ